MEKVIKELRYFNEQFPQSALEKAIANKEETTQILLKELDHLIENPRMITEDYMLHIYALFLLAQFREKEAFSKICELVSVSSEQADFMLGDIITEDLSSILYSTFDGDFNTLKSVIEDPVADVYVRGAALDVYGKLYSDGEVSKEEVITYLRKLMSNPYDRETDLANMMQGLVIDRHIFELIDDIQHLYDEGRIDEGIVGYYDSFIDFMYSYSYNRESVFYLDDSIKEMRKWGMFEQANTNPQKDEKDFEKLLKKLNKNDQTVTKTSKVGRNDPCPCGSGKKYKKCCLNKETSSEIKHQEYIEVQKKWLRDYPTTEGERNDYEVRITDSFDEEAIAIDRLVYLALHYRPSPIWEKRDREKEERIKLSYLIEAFTLFESKCEKEAIHSFDEYDNQHKIHYRSKEWIETLDTLIKRYDVTSNQEQLIEKLDWTIESFV
ncbi:hypothetical protein GCM10008932_17390 [Alkalibacterium iburiense]|uniref:SEC-C motif-containing protein n=1 Tax=Alkalibacterium iburiense TaxID=290589 RepID=A0ABN0XJB8_9LACT